MPKPWIAVLLSFFVTPLSMLYVGRARWALTYLLMLLSLGVWSLLNPSHGLLVSILQLTLVCGVACHAYRVAKYELGQKERPFYSRWPWLVLAVVVALLFFALFRVFFLEPFRISAGAMLPTLPIGSRVIVQKWGYGNYASYGIRLMSLPVAETLNRGNIVVFEFPRERKQSYVKRLIGLPGDRVIYRKKELYINGQAAGPGPLNDFFVESFATYIPAWQEELNGTKYSVLAKTDGLNPSPPPGQFPLRDKCMFDADGFECAVPPGHFFMMGDNRDNSFDSRFWGFVPSDHIIGKVIYIAR
jgi:signal peptidase I